jgi:hypothetical protein
MTEYSTFSGYSAQLREFIGACSSLHAHAVATVDARFDQLALSLFTLQFTHNQPYRQFCQSRKADPQHVRNWRDIPAMPAAGFKELELTSLPPAQRPHVFHSSGTTEQRPSRHFHNHESLSVYEASLLPWFQSNLPPARAGERPGFLMLTPSPELAPHSSLVHMFETLRRELGSPHSIFSGEMQPDGAWNLNLDKTLATLRAAIAANRPATLLGTAFNFVHLLDYLVTSNIRLQLPPGSCALETGGYKSRSRVLPKPKLHSLIADRLGIPASRIICEYGMCEISSQAYDSPVARPQTVPRVFHFPPWARAQIISPETGREVGEAETGLIRIFDLANVYSVMAIQTEDLGIRRGNGFELLGRASLAETRGCSLMSV